MSQELPKDFLKSINLPPGLDLSLFKKQKPLPAPPIAEDVRGEVEELIEIQPGALEPELTEAKGNDDELLDEDEDEQAESDDVVPLAPSIDQVSDEPEENDQIQLSQYRITETDEQDFEGTTQLGGETSARDAEDHTLTMVIPAAASGGEVEEDMREENEEYYEEGVEEGFNESYRDEDEDDEYDEDLYEDELGAQQASGILPSEILIQFETMIGELKHTIANPDTGGFKAKRDIGRAGGEQAVQSLLASPAFKELIENKFEEGGAEIVKLHANSEKIAKSMHWGIISVMLLVMATLTTLGVKVFLKEQQELQKAVAKAKKDSAEAKKAGDAFATQESQLAQQYRSKEAQLTAEQERALASLAERKTAVQRIIDTIESERASYNARMEQRIDTEGAQFLQELSADIVFISLKKLGYSLDERDKGDIETRVAELRTKGSNVSQIVDIILAAYANKAPKRNNTFEQRTNDEIAALKTLETELREFNTSNNLSTNASGMNAEVIWNLLARAFQEIEQFTVSQENPFMKAIDARVSIDRKFTLQDFSKLVDAIKDEIAKRQGKRNRWDVEKRDYHIVYTEACIRLLAAIRGLPLVEKMDEFENGMDLIKVSVQKLQDEIRRRRKK
jgi:hypothetical protein